MSINPLCSQYKQQFAWRRWPTIFDILPLLDGQVVLDLGCAVGDLAAELTRRGARVIGFDGNDYLLEVARARQLPNAEFHLANLRALPQLDEPVDGIWCSFVPAYFPNLEPVLCSWAAQLKPGGWVALIEVDDMFGHEPIAARTRELLAAFVADALNSSRYDFHMGSKLAAAAQRAGLEVVTTVELEDDELAFTGPAKPGVVEAWRARFERMKVFQKFCGPELDVVQADFLACLTRADHRCSARVCFCLAVKP